MYENHWTCQTQQVSWPSGYGTGPRGQGLQARDLHEVRVVCLFMWVLWCGYAIAALAQLAEHALRKRTVVGSIPTGGSCAGHGTDTQCSVSQLGSPEWRRHQSCAGMQNPQMTHTGYDARDQIRSAGRECQKTSSRTRSRSRRHILHYRQSSRNKLTTISRRRRK